MPAAGSQKLRQLPKWVQWLVWLLLTAAIIELVFYAAVRWVFPRATPTNTVLTYYRLMDKGDYPAAWAMMSKGFQDSQEGGYKGFEAYHASAIAGFRLLRRNVSWKTDTAAEVDADVSVRKRDGTRVPGSRYIRLERSRSAVPWVVAAIETEKPD